MDKKSRASSSKLFDIVIAVVTWIALILQVNASHNIANTFSYFTILSNLLVAVNLTIILLYPTSKLGNFFSKISTQSAITMYIIIVSLIYNFVIRTEWVQPPTRFLYNNILHIVTPTLYLIRWILFIPKGTLKRKDSAKWLSFPLIYLFYSLVRGAIIDWYPYFFVDLRIIDYSQLVVNVLLVAISFQVIGLILVAIDNFMGKKQLSKSS